MYVVYINIATELLTSFTVTADKARLTPAVAYTTDILVTYSSVVTPVVNLTTRFCNTSFYLPLHYRLLCVSLT